jgi:putative phosphoesterase
MKFAIVSDTHNNLKNFKKVITWLTKENIKLILHCGDLGSPEFLETVLADFDGKFFGVLGNMDRDYKTMVIDYNNIPNVKMEDKVLEIPIDKKMIAITHYPDTARRLAESGRYQFVFYGHTHKPWEEVVGNCKLVNPGEVAGQIYKPCFAIYDTNKNLLELKILERL